jgi:hypothetical protein
MDKDKELLEGAARAMRFPNWRYVGGTSGICVELGCRPGAITSYWNPLRSPDDAMILAVNLSLFNDLEKRASNIAAEHDFDITPLEATMRAITTMAAERAPAAEVPL